MTESAVSHPTILSGQMLLSAGYILRSESSMRVIPILDFSPYAVSSLVRNVMVNEAFCNSTGGGVGRIIVGREGESMEYPWVKVSAMNHLFLYHLAIWYMDPWQFCIWAH